MIREPAKKWGQGLDIVFNLRFCVLVAMCLVASHLQATPPVLTTSHDLFWSNLGGDFYDAPFFGDGVQGGTLLRDDQDPSAARVLMGHYKAITYSGVPNWEYCESRVYAASIVAKPFVAAERISGRTDICRGQVVATFEHAGQRANMSVFADRIHHVTVVVLESSQALDESALTIRPEWGITARLHIEKSPSPIPLEFVPPQPEVVNENGVRFILNRMAKRGGHTVSAQVIRLSPKKLALIVAIGTSADESPEEAVEKAKIESGKMLQSAVSDGVAWLKRKHTAWWSKYWSNSSISLPQDSFWENFWYLNLYKFASASSESAPLLIDTCGPWIWKSSWAAIWWNLNVQLSYYPMYSSNQLEAGKSYWLGMKRLYVSEVLHKNAEKRPGIHIGRSTTFLGQGSWGTELGNMPWVLHGLWKYWRYSGDVEMGKQLFPMMIDCLRYQESFLEAEPDGKLHIVASRSPEYKDGEFFYRDANYALSGIYWLLSAVRDMQDDLGIVSDQQAHWDSIESRLAPMPVNQNGLMIGADQGFDQSHRHYSHLLAIYPYHLINPLNGPKSRYIVTNSVNRWLSLNGAHAGYTFTGASAMLSTIGDGDRALSTLDLLKQKLTPNTMYAEGSPVIETPLSAVESLNYMMLQSWGGVIRVFPALPSRWQEASFKNLRAEGGVLVSADVRGGKLVKITLHHETGAKVTLEVPWGKASVKVRDSSGQTVNVNRSANRLQFELSAGKSYVISVDGTAQ